MSTVMPPAGVPAFEAGEVGFTMCRSVADTKSGSPETELASFPVSACHAAKEARSPGRLGLMKPVSKPTTEKWDEGPLVYKSL